MWGVRLSSLRCLHTGPKEQVPSPPPPALALATTQAPGTSRGLGRTDHRPHAALTPLRSCWGRGVPRARTEMRKDCPPCSLGVEVEAARGGGKGQVLLPWEGLRR